jgi:putative transposase
MAEITPLRIHSDWIGLDFMERERTPSELMKLGIRPQLFRRAFSITIRELERFLRLVIALAMCGG